jgi:Phosphoribulokinase / Uridine kinase family
MTFVWPIVPISGDRLLAHWACAKLTSLPAAPRNQPPVVGGLLASQLLTLFTTPVFYINMGKPREALSRPLTARLRDNRQPPQSRDACRVATVSSASSIFRWPGRTNCPRSDFRHRPGLRLPSIPSIWTSIWPTIGVRSRDFVGDRFGRVAERRCKIPGSSAILRRRPDYINYICPQLTHTDINFQLAPTVDTSTPFTSRWIPTLDESMVAIRFLDPHGIDFPSLLSMIHLSFMSRANSIVIPGESSPSLCSSSSRR